MKKNKSSLLFLLLVLATAVLGACSMDGGDQWLHYTDLGTITSVGDEGSSFYFRMRRDDGVELYAVENYAPDYELYEGKRVYCAYEILGSVNESSVDKAYYIRVLGFDNIISKPLVRESFILEDEDHRRDSIGNDLIRVYQAWFGGDYINIQFQYLRAENSKAKHLVSLVWDDTADDGIVHLYLRHNAYGETYPNYVMESATGFASFPMLETVGEDMPEIEVRLYYQWEANGQQVCLKQTFIPGSYNTQPVTMGNSVENFIMIPPGTTEHIE